MMNHRPSLYPLPAILLAVLTAALLALFVWYVAHADPDGGALSPPEWPTQTPPPPTGGYPGPLPRAARRRIFAHRGRGELSVIIYVPLDRIDDSPFQFRQDYGDIESLAADIKQNGLLQAPRGRLVANGFTGIADSVLHLPEDEIFKRGFRVQLVYGHRRLRAMRRLHELAPLRWQKMPVEIASLTDAEMLNAIWSENAHRADQNPIEQAELLAAKLEQARANGGNQATVAAEWGLARSTIANKLRLLTLPADVQGAIRTGRISERKALAMLAALDRGAEVPLPVAESNSSDALRMAARSGSSWQRPGSTNSIGPTDLIPMLVHGHVAGTPDADTWRIVVKAARAACNRCIRQVGPAIPSVCRECPGVTMIKALNRELTERRTQEAPAP